MTAAHLRAPDVRPIVNLAYRPGCSGKMRYPTAPTAALAARALHCCHYRCCHSECGGWHIGADALLPRSIRFASAGARPHE